MTAEVLGVRSNNKELTNLQSTVCHQKIQDQKEQMEEVIHFVDDEINELESFKDAISNLKGYIALRNSQRARFQKAVDLYNNYLTTGTTKPKTATITNTASINKVALFDGTESMNPSGEDDDFVLLS